MDRDKPNTDKFIPEIGRGCAFRDNGTDIEARPCDGCFKLHETAWMEGYPDNIPTDIFEVRFKNTRRSFYRNVNGLDLQRGDIVAVEASPGHDIGIVSLTGDMVAKQMRRTGFNPFNGEFRKIYRKAKPYDIERWQEAIALEHETMIAARQIAADMGLNMKIGDVEYQGDKIKAIFYYIADERVDFRELIKVFAERFHIRIEMKQIGARQEAGRIGGLGACGRELCCASWISSFSSVTTGAARAQEISLNPQKLAGQCSKLKCCMMYEYDAYVDARKEFPRLREPLQTIEGEWFLVKSDILAGTMTFSSAKETMSNLTTLSVGRVKEILSLNRAGKKADRLQDAEAIGAAVEEPTYRSGSDEDSITRFDKTKRRKRGGRNGRNGDRREERREHTRPEAKVQHADREGGSDRSETQRRPERPDGTEQAPRTHRTDERRAEGAPRNGDRPRRERSDRPGRPEHSERRENGTRNRNDRRRPGGNAEGHQGKTHEGSEPRPDTANSGPREQRDGEPRNASADRQRPRRPRNEEQGDAPRRPRNERNGNRPRQEERAPESKPANE